MTWAIEYRPSAQQDLRAIFLHLARVHHEQFGLDFDAARERSRARIRGILDDAERLCRMPHSGTRHVVQEHEFRHITLNRAIFWFTLNEARRTICIEGIFHGGQDHLGRMLSRLTSEGEAG